MHLRIQIHRLQNYKRAAQLLLVSFFSLTWRKVKMETAVRVMAMWWQSLEPKFVCFVSFFKIREFTKFYTQGYWRSALWTYSKVHRENTILLERWLTCVSHFIVQLQNDPKHVIVFCKKTFNFLQQICWNIFSCVFQETQFVSIFSYSSIHLRTLIIWMNFPLEVYYTFEMERGRLHEIDNNYLNRVHHKHADNFQVASQVVIALTNNKIWFVKLLCKVKWILNFFFIFAQFFYRQENFNFPVIIIIDIYMHISLIFPVTKSRYHI